jgi:glycosyltransferase involved in cell wall biosynthesis
MLAHERQSCRADRQVPIVRVVVDARLRSGDWGGVEGVVIGLARGIASLDDDGSSYMFLVERNEEQFLEPYLGNNSSLLYALQPPRVRRLAGRVRRKARSVFPSRGPGPRAGRSAPLALPLSDGAIERAGADLMHFTFQAGFRTDVPSIYHPHDLQHLHLPQFFDPSEISSREYVYRELCDQAAMVAVASHWTKTDVQRHYELAAEKVRVVELAPPTAAYSPPEPARGEMLRRQMGAPDAYILYPAQTWAHKNHIRLLRALAVLRDEGVQVPLVAVGRQNAHYKEIRSEQSRLELGEQVVWPGFVSEEALLSLYEGATAVVIPTLFEAGSFPLWEAFRAGKPAACSNVTSLPEQAGDAALLFDPNDTRAMAHAIQRLWTDRGLRASLRERGRRRLRSLSWSATARHFRAHYRRIVGVPLTDEDHSMIAKREAPG